MDDAPFAGRSLHFIGIGGAGMSGLALVAHALGARGDAAPTGPTRPTSSALRAAGIEAASATTPPTCPTGAEVVVSTAIAGGQPRAGAARASAGATCCTAATCSASCRALKRTIAVAGAHGKTTTAAMVAHVLRGAGRDPAYLIGGELRSAGTNAALGGGDWAVVEADESDRSFLKLAPRGGGGHQRRARPPRDLPLASRELERGVRGVRGARAAARSLGPGVDLRRRRRLALRRSATGDLRAERRRAAAAAASRFEVERRARRAARARAPQRAERARARWRRAARRASSRPRPRRALRGFAGAGRRFEAHGAHRARARSSTTTTPTTRPRCAPRSRRRARCEAAAGLVACFQPHLYSRTRQLAREFGRALALADVVVVLDVYPARERAEDFPGVSGLLVAQAAADAAARAAGLVAAAMDDAERLLRERAGRGRPAAHARRRRRRRGWRDAPARRTAVSAPRRGRARLPARAADHRPHRRARPTASPARTRAERLAELLAWARRRGHRGRSGRVRLEPADSRCGIPRTGDEAGRLARHDRAGRRAPALRRRRPPAAGRRRRRARGAERASSSA